VRHEDIEDTIHIEGITSRISDRLLCPPMTQTLSLIFCPPPPPPPLLPQGLKELVGQHPSLATRELSSILEAALELLLDPEDSVSLMTWCYTRNHLVLHTIGRWASLAYGLVLHTKTGHTRAVEHPGGGALGCSLTRRTR
jgi:hypothetical protein